MKVVALFVLLLVAPVLASAEGPKPCEDLKSEIAKKLDAKNVKDYTLEIVAKDADAEGKVVGTCEAGAKKIVYSKTSAAPKAPSTDSGSAPTKP